MSQLQNLKNAIHMDNEFNRIAGPILEHVQQVTEKFVGKKVTTLKGLADKYKEAVKFDLDSIDVKPLDGAKYAKLHLAYVSNYSNDLTLKVSICFGNGAGHGCTYKENTYWFGKIENGILSSVNHDVKVSQVKLDFQEQVAAIKNYLVAEKALEQAKSKIKVGREVYQYFSLENLK